MNLEYCLKGKGPHKPDFAYDIVRIHFLMINTAVIELHYRGRHEGSLAVLFIFFFEVQVWRHYNYWTVHELSNI